MGNPENPTPDSHEPLIENYEHITKTFEGRNTAETRTFSIDEMRQEIERMAHIESGNLTPIEVDTNETGEIFRVYFSLSKEAIFKKFNETDTAYEYLFTVSGGRSTADGSKTTCIDLVEVDASRSVIFANTIAEYRDNSWSA